MPLVAVRGGRRLTEAELRSHLALVLRLENVGAFLGAGASCCAGGRTIAEMWQAFRDDYAESYAFLRDQAFITEAEHAAPDKINLEAKLDQINTAEAEWTRANANAESLEDLRKARNDLYRAVMKCAELSPDLWADYGAFLTSPRIAVHRLFLTKLVGNRLPGQSSPWIFSTNYDLAVEWACEGLGLHVINGFSGIHNRLFAPQNFDLGFRNVHARGEARFGVYNCYLVKLHGSLSWVGDNKAGVRELAADFAKERIDRFLAGDAAMASPGFLIYPGASKYVETTGFIFGELVRKFSEFLTRAQTGILVSGYSFSDEHLNRVLMSALQNPTLQMVIYCPELVSVANDPYIDAPGKPWLQELIGLRLPQVTLVGSGNSAYFAELASQLAEPALVDDRSEQARRLMAAIERAATAGAALADPQGGGAQEAAGED
jgi:hypothetical protein